VAELTLKGLGGRRGPLEPGLDLRIKLAFWFLLLVPACAFAASALVVWLDDRKLDESLAGYWLGYTALLWCIVFGDVTGRRIYSAVGYPRSEAFGRLAELVFVLTCFALCGAVAAILYPPRGALLPVIGAMIFLIMGVVVFVRGMIAK
jgi:hypothetical protein